MGAPRASNRMDEGMTTQRCLRRIIRIRFDRVYSTRPKEIFSSGPLLSRAKYSKPEVGKRSQSLGRTDVSRIQLRRLHAIRASLGPRTLIKFHPDRPPAG